MQTNPKVCLSGATCRGANHENSTQGYTMSTHDDDHQSGNMYDGDFLIAIEDPL